MFLFGLLLVTCRFIHLMTLPLSVKGWRLIYKSLVLMGSDRGFFSVPHLMWQATFIPMGYRLSLRIETFPFPPESLADERAQWALTITHARVEEIRVNIEHFPYNSQLLGAFRQSSQNIPWKENGGSNGNNASESHKPITLNVLWMLILKTAFITVR